MGSHLNAQNVLKAITKYLSDLGIELANDRFFCMDTTNMSSSKNSGMKRLLQHTISLAVWIGCGNHKVALCFKHLLQVYPDVLTADATLLVLWKFLHYRPLATNFVNNTAEMYDKKQVTQICPSVTRWAIHDRASKNLYDSFKQIVPALATCVNKRKEPDALGIFMKVTSPKVSCYLTYLQE